MNPDLKHKIDKIADGAYLSGWDYHTCQPEDMVLTARVFYWLTAKNGKRCFVGAFGVAVIDGETQKRPYLEVEQIKYEKRHTAKSALRDFIQSQFQKRIGLLSHRGYFKFVDIKAYDGG